MLDYIESSNVSIGFFSHNFIFVFMKLNRLIKVKYPRKLMLIDDTTCHAYLIQRILHTRCKIKLIIV
jgi:hypothetical protein